MQIVLLKDVTEGNVVKVTHRRSKKQVIGWYEGTVIDVSDETARKLIERGDAKEQPPTVIEKIKRMFT